MKLYGKNSVIERLRSSPHTIRQIYLQEDHVDRGYFQKKAKQWNIPVFVVPRSKILKLARNTNTQGILVDVDDFLYAELDDVIDLALHKKHTLIFLDGLNDPQNLGAIIRSLACLGKFSIVLPTHDSVQVTEAVLRVASGGDNHIKIARVSNLGNAIRRTKEAGLFIAGSVISGGQDIMDTAIPYPLGLVIGSEQKGIRDVIRKLLDLELTIPMSMDRLSFNVAHATAILCYEIARQKQQKKS